MSSILGQSGRQMVEFGSASAWKVRTKCGIVCSFQWLDIGHESGEPQACMCLYPTTRRMDNGAYVLPQENAWRFVDNKGSPTPHLMAAAFKYCTVSGTFPDKSTIHRVMDIVADGLPDLIQMPNSQPIALDKGKAVQGIEVALKVDGKTFYEAVV